MLKCLTKDIKTAAAETKNLCKLRITTTLLVKVTEEDFLSYIVDQRIKKYCLPFKCLLPW